MRDLSARIASTKQVVFAICRMLLPSMPRSVAMYVKIFASDTLSAWAASNRNVQIMKIFEAYQNSGAILKDFKFCQCGEKIRTAENVKIILTSNEDDIYDGISFEIEFLGTNQKWCFKNIPYGSFSKEPVHN